MDLYGVLGVEKTASQDEIKRAYRKLAQETHPDKNDGDGSKFEPVKAAYEVLSDPGRRERYDQTGDDGRVPDKHVEAKNMLAQMVMQIIDTRDPVTTDIVAVARTQVTHQISVAEQEKRAAQKKIDDRRKVLERMTASDDGFMCQVIENDIRQREGLLARIDDGIEIMREALKMLDEYSYKADAPVHWVGNLNGFSQHVRVWTL